MNRLIARTAFFVTLFVLAVVAGIFLGPLLPGHIGGGLSGGLGAVIAMYAPRLFDAYWPKPKQGWSE